MFRRKFVTNFRTKWIINQIICWSAIHTRVCICMNDILTVCSTDYTRVKIVNMFLTLSLSLSSSPSISISLAISRCMLEVIDLKSSSRTLNTITMNNKTTCYAYVRCSVSLALWLNLLWLDLLLIRIMSALNYIVLLLVVALAEGTPWQIQNYPYTDVGNGQNFSAFPHHNNNYNNNYYNYNQGRFNEMSE